MKNKIKKERRECEWSDCKKGFICNKTSLKRFCQEHSKESFRFRVSILRGYK